MTFTSNMILLLSLGLLKRCRPNERSRATAMRTAYRTSLIKGNRPVSFFAVPEYTPEVIAKAESVLATFEANGVNTSKITHDSLIRAIGKEKANEIYVTFTNVSHKRTTAEQALLDAVEDELSYKPYTTKQEILALAAHDVDMKMIVRTWQTENRRLLKLCSAEYRAPRKTDYFSDRLENRSWIVCKRDSVKR